MAVSQKILTLFNQLFLQVQEEKTQKNWYIQDIAILILNVKNNLEVSWDTVATGDHWRFPG